MAIIVSVAMVTAVFTSAISFIKFMQNITVAVDGDWHISFVAPDYQGAAEYLSRDEDVDTVGTRISLGTAYISVNDGDSSAELKAVNRNWLDMQKVEVSEGRYPQDSSEIIVIRKFIERLNLDWRVGTELQAEINANGANEKNPELTKKTLKIVGITDSKVSATDTSSVFFAGVDSEAIANASTILNVVKFKKLDNSVWDKADKIKNDLKIESYSHNYELFAYSFVMRTNYVLKAIGGFGGILLAIIAVVSIFMIYDSFAVSYQERAKYLGMLASVGATKSQKRASVYFEGLIFGLIGIPLGIGAGIGGIAVTFKCIEGVLLSTLAVEYDHPMKVYVNWIVILGTVFFSALTIFISAYFPARRASKTTAIEAIKQTNTFKIKNAKKLKTSKLKAKLLGYEGVMAVKNFKRNGKRSRNIVFSLALSVVVFMTVANFSSMMGKAFEMNYMNYSDASATVDYKEAEKLNEIIRSTPEITSFIGFADHSAEADSSLRSVDAVKYKFAQTVWLVFLDNTSFDSYLNQLGEDASLYHNADKPRAIILNKGIARDGDRKVSIEPLKDMDTFVGNIKLYPQASADVEPESVNKPVSLDIGIMTTELWQNDKFVYQNAGQPLIILSFDYAESIMENDVESSLVYFADMSCEDAEKTVELLQAKVNNANIPASVFSSSSRMQTEMNVLKIAKVFIFGFITLITMISILNIVNTIANSMNERRREFAMIRSVGMSLPGFRKMIYYESFRYGVFALLWSIPISVAIQVILYKTLSEGLDYGMSLNIPYYLAASVAVFVIIGFALFYSVGRIKDDNIIETLKEDIG